MLCALTRDMSNCCAGWGSRFNACQNRLRWRAVYLWSSSESDIEDQPPATAGGSDSWPEPLPVFSRGNKRLNHLSADEVAVELVQLVQPEVIAGVVCVLRIVRVATQVTKELHQHERSIELLLIEDRVLGYHAQCAGARGHVAGIARGTEFIDCCLPITDRKSTRLNSSHSQIS